MNCPICNIPANKFGKDRTMEAKVTDHVWSIQELIANNTL